MTLCLNQFIPIPYVLPRNKNMCLKQTNNCTNHGSMNNINSLSCAGISVRNSWNACKIISTGQELWLLCKNCLVSQLETGCCMLLHFWFRFSCNFSPQTVICQTTQSVRFEEMSIQIESWSFAYKENGHYDCDEYTRSSLVHWQPLICHKTVICA